MINGLGSAVSVGSSSTGFASELASAAADAGNPTTKEAATSGAGKNFKSLDLNGDGKLSAKELKAMLLAYDPKAMATGGMDPNIFKQFLDNSGITGQLRSDLMKLVDGSQPGRPGTILLHPKIADIVATILKDADTNGNKGLDLSEFKTAMPNASSPSTAPTLDFGKLDLNGDGKLSPKELKAMLLGYDPKALALGGMNPYVFKQFLDDAGISGQLRSDLMKLVDGSQPGRPGTILLFPKLDDIIATILKDADTNGNKRLDLSEFKAAMPNAKAPADLVG